MQALLRLNRRHWSAFTLALVAVVTVLSLLPVDRLPLAGALVYDKLDHIAAYAGVALSAALARPRRWWLAMAALIAWSAGIEAVQPLVGRARDAADIAANGLGVLLAAGISSAVRRIAVSPT